MDNFADCIKCILNKRSSPYQFWISIVKLLKHWSFYSCKSCIIVTVFVYGDFILMLPLF